MQLAFASQKVLILPEGNRRYGIFFSIKGLPESPRRIERIQPDGIWYVFRQGVLEGPLTSHYFLQHLFKAVP